jgi:hypothetical protein
MENNDKIINMEAVNKKEERLKRKFEVISDITVKSVKLQFQDIRTWQAAAAVGLVQGLKYRGNLGQGMKAGVATVGVLTGVNVISNLIKNSDNIKKA